MVGNGYNSEIFFIRSTEGHPCQGNVGLKDEADESGHEQRDRDSCSRLFLDRPIRLAYAGKISKSKGIPSLLRAIKRIEGYKLELHLAGGASDPEEYAEIVEQAKGSRHSIRFLGPLTQPELSELYASCDLFVFPSYYEGLGLAVFEAMACGLRVVVSNTEGLQDWICKNIKDPPILFVKLPMMRAVDIPVEEELPRYEEDFANAIVRQIEELEKADFAKVSIDMSMLSWDSIARRILKSF